MIVKVESKNGNFKRLDDCDTACFCPDIVEPESDDVKRWNLICAYSNGRDNTYPLDSGDTIYFMNNLGKTVDKIHI